MIFKATNDNYCTSIWLVESEKEVKKGREVTRGLLYKIVGRKWSNDQQISTA